METWYVRRLAAECLTKPARNHVLLGRANASKTAFFLGGTMSFLPAFLG